MQPTWDDQPSSNGLRFGTNAIHAGQKPDPTTGAVMIPISLSTTFAQASPGVHKSGCVPWSAAVPLCRSHQGYEYSRTGNPTRDAFEACIAALEGGEWAVAASSGSAALASVLMLLVPGDRIVSSADVYGGTRRYFSRLAAPRGLVFDFVDLTDKTAAAAAITPGTKLVWLETPTNPTLAVSDIRAIAELTKAAGALLVVDNTFMTPYLQQPLLLGADLVVHSVTKFLNGHSDVVMGVVVGRGEDLLTKFRFIQNGLGAVPSPFDCFLALRGLKTLHVRMQAHCANALRIAQWLEAHPKVRGVRYPALPSHPQHATQAAQARGGGGVITIWLKGGLEQARQFLETVKLFALAESLGGVESLIEHPAIMTHASVPPEARAALGIDDSLVRLSVGIENVEDLIADLDAALGAVKLE